MLKQTFIISILSVTLPVSLASSTLATPKDFVGTWVNTDPNTRGITQFTITKQGSNGLLINVFGKCHPTDCNWGFVLLVTHGNNVQDSDHTNATAVYNQGFSMTFLTLHLRNTGRNQINLQSFTQFTDNSGRQNYSAQDNFKLRSRDEDYTSPPAIVPSLGSPSLLTPSPTYEPVQPKKQCVLVTSDGRTISSSLLCND